MTNPKTARETFDGMPALEPARPAAYDREDARARFHAKVAEAERAKAAGEGAPSPLASQTAPTSGKKKLVRTVDDPNADPALQRAFTLLAKARPEASSTDAVEARTGAPEQAADDPTAAKKGQGAPSHGPMPATAARPPSARSARGSQAPTSRYAWAPFTPSAC